MSEWLLLVAAAFLAFLGCASLALSLPRNWLAVVGEPLGATDMAITRRTGWLTLLTALLPCAIRDGPGFAALAWPLLFALSAFLVAMSLSYRAFLLRPITDFYRRLARFLRACSPR